jgi:hypothetical protein
VPTTSVVDPDPDLGGQKRSTIIKKDISFLEVLDVLKASPVAWMSFIDA